MFVFFCDTSGLVKRYVAETGSAWLTSQIAPTNGSRVYTDLNAAAVSEGLTVDNPNNH